MLTAVHTYSFRDLALEDALDAVVDLGATSVELWVGHVADGSPAAAASALERRGLRVAAVGAGGFYRADETGLERALALARAVGTDVIVACVAPSIVDLLTERIPPDVTLCLENHWDQALARPEDVLAVLDRGRFAACLDTGHAILAGVAPERFARMLGLRLGHVHLKDARSRTGLDTLLGRRLRRRLLRRPEPVSPGSGSLDIPALRLVLEDIGFGGAVSLEHEGGDPTASLGALRELWAA